MVRRGRVICGTALLLALSPSWSFKTSPFQQGRRQRQQQQQQQQQQPMVSLERRRTAHSIQCAAVTLAAYRSPVFDADEFDPAPPSIDNQAERPRAGFRPRDASRAKGGGRRGSHSSKRMEGPTGYAGGSVVVLSDWLDELDELAHGNQGHVEVISSEDVDERAGDGSAPFRFQQLIQQMWAMLNRYNQLEYLDKEGRGKVKQALTVLAAYSALREHPLQAGVESPQQAFSEMDFDRDGEVSFDEFVRWYSTSTARNEPKQLSPQPGSGTDSDTAGGVRVADPSPTEVALGSKTLSATASGRGSRLLADVEKSLALTSRQIGSAPIAGQPPRSAAVQPTPSEAGPDDRVGAASYVRAKSWLSLSVTAAATTGPGHGPTEQEKEAARERWLAGAAAETGMETVGPESADDSAVKDLEKALDMLCVLVKAHADADTLIAALASCIVRNPKGRYNLKVIEEQFGPIIRGIVEDRLLLERLPEPTSSASYLAIKQSFGVKPVLDLDDKHAKLMRDYLVHFSRDARAVVVHMADLTCRLRDPSKTPPHARHTLALEALQLYVPVSNALGLGSSFRELEELGYKTIFPRTYSNIALWHRDVKGRSHDIVRDVKKRMLEALHAREDIASRVHSYHLEGRTKALVSTFRKVFRQNKRANDVHDIIGFRIIVMPKTPGTRSRTAAGREGDRDTERKEKRAGDNTKKISEDDRAVGKRSGSTPAGSVFTVKTFPPPYRDADSRLLHDVYEVLIGLFDEVPGRFKNYVDFPKRNGYRSVHTTVVHPTGIKMEFQVRTAFMHAEAEVGSASHSLYKGELESPEEASLFRSKMTPNILSPTHRQLPSKTKSSETAAAVQPAADNTTESRDTTVPEIGPAGAVSVSNLDMSDRSPEP